MTNSSFQSLGLSQSILSTLAEEGYESPTPIQAASIPSLLEGRDLLGTAQTGTGKTAAFALPIIQNLASKPRRPNPKSCRALIVAPTRELAAQIDDSFAAYGRRAGLSRACIFGGVGKTPQIRSLFRGVDVLVATPGRLLDLHGEGALRLDSVEIVVLDEADRMLDMGFIRDVRKIVALLPRERQTLLFSATMPRDIEELAASILRKPVRVAVAPEKPAVELIEQRVARLPKAGKRAFIVEYIRAEAVERAVVFTRTKHGADRLARGLSSDGIEAEAIHANKSQGARTKTLGGFKSGKLRVLVATDLAARGIDVDGITHVFNYELPNEPETYVHRIGRTARAGASGTAIALCDDEEKPLLKAIERLLGRGIPEAGGERFRSSFEAADIAAREKPAEAPRPERSVRGGRPERPARGEHAASGERAARDERKDHAERAVSSRERRSPSPHSGQRQERASSLERGNHALRRAASSRGATFRPESGYARGPRPGQRPGSRPGQQAGQRPGQ